MLTKASFLGAQLDVTLDLCGNSDDYQDYGV